MKSMMIAATALALSIGAGQAQSMNKTDDMKQQSPGTTGAMGNVNKDGVATDPEGVKAQQGRSSDSSPGTVGATPGAEMPSKK